MPNQAASASLRSQTLWTGIDAPGASDLDEPQSSVQAWFGADSEPAVPVSFVQPPQGAGYIVDDDGRISPVSQVGAPPPSPGAAPPPRPGNQGTASGTTIVALPTTAISNSAGFEIELVWDSSVSKAPSGFETAVIDAARYYVSLISTRETVAIDVGYGEIAGSSMAFNALGESESYGILTNYSTIESALTKTDGASISVGSASNEPSASTQFFVTSAEAMALGGLGQINSSSTALGGYVGFSTLGGGSSWNLTANPNGSNSGTGSNQYDLEAVAEHEISEVMGRQAMEGTSTFDGIATDAPLDLFDYASSKMLSLSANGGYFSTTDGATSLGVYNDARKYGGDIADWASALSPSQSQTGVGSGYYDAFNAFSSAGLNGMVTSADLSEMQALGYHFNTVAPTIKIS